MRFALRLVALWGVVAGTTVAFAGDARTPDKLEKKLQDVRTLYAEKLEPVLELSLKKGDAKAAKTLLALMERNGPARKSLPALGARVAAVVESATEKDKKEVAGKVKYAGEAHALKLMEVAADLYKAHRLSRSYEIVGEALEVNPDHRKARQLKGYEEVEVDRKKAWVTRFEANQLRAGMVLFTNSAGEAEGWIPARDKARWAKGERPLDGGWVSAEVERTRRGADESQWFTVESERFAVTTPVSRAAAYAFGQELERFHRTFLDAFIGFFDADKGVELMFNLEAPTKKHLIQVFADRDAYVAHVKGKHEGNATLLASVGFYHHGDQKCRKGSHFYLGEHNAKAITVHEVTHQLFAESRSVDKRGQTSANEWICEGVATFAEGWVEDEKARTLRARTWVAEHPRWSLADLVGLDSRTFHDGYDRGTHYDLSGTLVSFLMTTGGGARREGFVRLLVRYYDANVPVSAVAESIGAELEALDREFKDFLRRAGPPEVLSVK